ncbi:HAD family phosphatase [Candidatus Saccharibacteria bacterium]|nr:HAD family phosphatase [Candidatus Saccharibacteria bacterium]
MNQHVTTNRLGFVPKAAIFDIDDTLLDNKPHATTSGLHEKSRLQAVHEVGRKHGVKELVSLTTKQNHIAFTTAPVHTLEGAVWNIMNMVGLADSQTINRDDPIFQEIVALKNELHEDVLRQEGEPLPGAVAFVRSLAKVVDGRVAIASTAIRKEIDIFLEKTELRELFQDAAIISKEKMTHPKPHPDAFDQAFRALGLSDSARAHTVAFEDDPRGIMSAKAAGLYTCAITHRYSREELQNLEIAPDMIADSFAEFADIFGLKS